MTETVNLALLFASQGAVADALAAGEQRRELSSDALRLCFSDQGVAVTAYDGLVRQSMPRTVWQADELAHLRTTLHTLA